MDNFIINQSDMCYDARILFHSELYNDENSINTLKQYIELLIPTITCNYDIREKRFIIKIKKTLASKIPNFEHSSIYYTSVLCKVFRMFFADNKSRILKILRSAPHNYNEQELVYGLTTDESLILSMFSVYIVSDNTLVVSI